MTRHFTHLHLHTEYSLLDGAIGIDDLVAFGKQQQLRSLAISDHGNIFGAVRFFQAAKKAGIKPILGMEAYFTEDCSIRQSEKKYYHLLLLVENEIGYKNLCALIAASHTIGFYFKPRIDYALLAAHSEGLIVTSACLGGHIPTLLMAEQYDSAYERAAWFIERFGTERFYLEVQPADQPEQKILNERIFEMSRRTGLSVVATADCHYVHKEDRHAHEVMLAVQTRTTMHDPERFTFGDCRAYMRTTDEMLALFPDTPEVVWNSGVIADRCSFDFTTGKLYFPAYPLPEGKTQDAYFSELCWQGLEALYDQGRIDRSSAAVYESRLREEIALISAMGFITYFLVVSDFIRWAKRQDIPVGPGRGSAAGSLVAWVLEITDVDPIRYHLLFERFLNPERISMPDIDIDFCVEGRDRVISYVRERYGHDHVCQIITFGTMMAKGVIKDVARALGFPFEDSQAITELIPEQLKITLQEAIDQEPKLQQLINNNPKIAELFQIAFRLEGLTRHASKHAAGVVITPEPVVTMLPVYIPPKTDELVTQYSMTDLELLGFLKMDFLGLKNLTLIKHVLAMIAENHGILLHSALVPLDDPKTFALLCRGDTSGVFQLESSGLKDVLRRLQPDKFEDIIAVNALYRPGPLNSGMVDDFINRRHGKASITYIFPELEPILAETYGVIVYQEQVMHIASAIGGFSLGEADILRRAMGKKKADEMARQKEIFVTRAVERGYAGTKAAELFDLMAYFAGYGFNKSHSTAYALIAYQTAYLKAHYAPEFMAALITLETNAPETMSAYLHEAKSMGIPVLLPDINRSMVSFVARDGAIIFGLQGIKHVGQAVLVDLLEKRTQGPFLSLVDFCMRVDLRALNKRVLESLVYAGAFDQLHGNRAQCCAALADIIEQVTLYKKEQITGQLNLFQSTRSDLSDARTQTIDYTMPAITDWPLMERLEHEKEVLGLFLSAHPLDAYRLYVRALEAAACPAGTIVAAGLMTKHKVITTKKGDQMAFATFELADRIVELIIFPKVFRALGDWHERYMLFVVKAIVDGSKADALKVQTLLPIDLIVTQGYGISQMICHFPRQPDAQLFAACKAVIRPGSTQLIIRFVGAQGPVEIVVRTRITVTQELMQFCEEHTVTVQLLIA